MPKAKSNLKTHGMTGHPLHKIWKGIWLRVRSNKFPYYHGKGIQCCERWRSFELFYQDMGPTWAPGLEIDRIDPAGNYEPSNCRWSTRLENCNNKSNTRRVVYRGQEMSVADAARLAGIVPLHVAYSRIFKYGWDVVAAVETPKTNQRGTPISVDGQVYASMTAAAEALGVTRSAIYNRLKGKTGKVFYLAGGAAS